MISDFTELATRLYFWADCKARFVRERDRLRVFFPGSNADHRPETQVGENFGTVQLDQLGAFCRQS